MDKNREMKNTFLIAKDSREAHYKNAMRSIHQPLTVSLRPLAPFLVILSVGTRGNDWGGKNGYMQRAEGSYVREGMSKTAAS